MSALPSFPCSTFPADATHCKLLGLYPQLQEGLWMQRVVVPGGLLTADQWRTLARLAREVTPDTPLHLTTRQDVEFHNLTAAQVPLVQQALAAAGLTTMGAGGDTLRNTTVCSCSGLKAAAVDLQGLALRINGLLRRYGNIYRLPRKFKISLSACPKSCGRPWINDLGLIAAQRDGRWGFEAIAGGSLGAKPATGVRCFEWLEAADVLPLSLAALRVFDTTGDREHRNKARLRHVRERMGDQAFVAMLQAELDKARAEQAWPAIELSPTQAGATGRVVLTFANGDVSPQAADALASLMENSATAVRILTTHQVAVYGPGVQAVQAALANQPALQSAGTRQPCVVACPGNRWCERGLVSTNQMADLIRRSIGPSYAGVVAVSGCPNGCAHSATADIGLSGQAGTRDGERVEMFRLTVGGGNGRDGRLGEFVLLGTAQEVMEKIKAIAAKRD